MATINKMLDHIGTQIYTYRDSYGHAYIHAKNANIYIHIYTNTDIPTIKNAHTYTNIFIISYKHTYT